MNAVLAVAPTDEPITLAEAKEHLRVTIDDDDDLLHGLIAAARRWAEQFTWRAFVTQTWDLSLDCFPDCIRVPYPKLQSVEYIRYIDTNGTQQTLAASEYTVDTVSEPGRIVPAYGKVWPSARLHVNSITVRFVAGYGDGAAVPEDIKSAIKLVLSELYERREQSVVGTIIQKVPLNAEYLLRFHRANVY